jgi:Na+/H+ antiporter NhaD/arsenite permease-like protein
MKELAIGLFLLNYILLFRFPKKRAHIAMGFALLFVVIGLIPLNEVPQAIQWNALMMLAGTMGLVSLFIESNMPAFLADILIEKMPNVRWTLVGLSIFAGIISAFVDNVATVLMIAPLVLSFSRKIKMSPVIGMISIAIFSNLQGAATLVGDTTSILLGGYANLSFFDFFWLDGKPGLFWIVQAGTVGAAILLSWMFRKYTQPIEALERSPIESMFPSYLMISMLGLLIINSLIPNSPSWSSGAICIALFIIGVLKSMWVKKSVQPLSFHLKNIDGFTLLLLTGLFIMIGGLGYTGVIADLSAWFLSIGQSNVLLMFTLIVWISVFLSAFIDNIPYVASMLPVVGSIAISMNISPNLFYFGLLIGATLGGNMSPLGASANVTAIGILRQEGYHVETKTYMKLGIPITLVAVIIGYLLTLVIWS